MIREILPGIVEVTTATTGGSELLSSRCIFLHKVREALAYLGYFDAKLTHLGMLPKLHPHVRYSYKAIGVLRIFLLQQSVCDFIRSACIGFWCGWTEPHRVKVRVIRISSSPQPAGGIEKLSISGFVNYYQTNTDELWLFGRIICYADQFSTAGQK